MNIEELYDLFLKNPSVQTDTRKLKPGDLFFALKGDNFNGNRFAQQAVDAGAAWAVIDEKEFEIPGKTLLVEDVLTTLQELAGYHRRQFKIPFIAITGSNGKTTTKELIHAVLSRAFSVYTTEGNLNNHIGVPLTLLKIRKDAEIAVIEMGANHLHEIESYCRIADPTHGLITNCGKAHLEGFGSLEGVRKAKGELYDHLRERGDGTAWVMWDYDYLREMSRGIHRILTYGTGNATVVGTVTESAPFLKMNVQIEKDHIAIDTRLVGAYNLPNVLAAVAVGIEMGVPPDQIRDAIEKFLPSNSRSQLIEKGTNTFILDAYNANPTSMKEAIENFAEIAQPRKILVLGAMAEMGSETAKEHENLVKLIENYSWTDVVLVGLPFEPYKNKFRYFEDSDAAGKWFQQQHFDHTWFLVKGSRTTAMEKIPDLSGIA
jgi:UDP-N-acetylmuramoyl-tripeptide--D-alanyl-D-alanine ligase